jgi:hypothetical protein
MRVHEANISATSLLQAMFDAIRKLAIAVNASADTPNLAADERGPDDDPRLQFEAAGIAGGLQ